MRVLLLNQFFWPDSAPTGVLLEDVARQLVLKGCDVTVICGGSEYAAPRQDPAPPVTIVRLPGLAYSRARWARLRSWAWSLLGTAVRSLFLPRFDVVVTLTTPPAMALVGMLLKKLRSTRFLIWEMDVFPDVAISLGEIRRGSLAERSLTWIFNMVRRQADGIIALGDCMRDRLLAHRIDERKIVVAENWSDSRVIQPVELPPCDPLTILYSGNLGLAHEIETISDVMLALRERTDVQFVFTGAGARRISLERFCAAHNLANVRFQGYVDVELLSASLGACHLGLITMNSACVGTVVPSKAYAFLAAGRPLLFIGLKTAMTARLTDQGCGWQFEPGDVNGILELMERLRANPELIQRAAARCRELFKARYDAPQGSARVAELIAGQLPLTSREPISTEPARLDGRINVS